MKQGVVYVMVNSFYPGLVKVGRTTRTGQQRVAELSGATGVALPFVLAYEQDFADCVAAERAVHAELDNQGLRLVPNREFFRGSPGDIIRLIQSHAAGYAPVSGNAHADPALAERRAEQAARLLAEADAHLHGTGRTFQDTAAAARAYHAAAAAGSLVALERLGALYARHRTGHPRADRRRAMRLLKQGAGAGNYYCYSEMARLFAGDGHAANFTKAWDLFFERRAAGRCEEADMPGRFPQACQTYVAGCFTLGIAPQHAADMAGEALDIVSTLLQSLDAAGMSAALRDLLLASLRWVYETLLPVDPVPVWRGAALPAQQERPAFVKKDAKNFYDLRAWFDWHARRRSKVFWFFFSKKNIFLEPR